MVVPSAGIVVAARRLMRKHQHIPPSRGRVPMWRLLLGELAVGFRALFRRRG